MTTRAIRFFEAATAAFLAGVGALASGAEFASNFWLHLLTGVAFTLALVAGATVLVKMALTMLVALRDDIIRELRPPMQHPDAGPSP